MELDKVYFVGVPDVSTRATRGRSIRPPAAGYRFSVFCILSFCLSSVILAGVIILNAHADRRLLMVYSMLSATMLNAQIDTSPPRSTATIIHMRGQQDSRGSDSATIILGTLGVLVAIIGLAIALLQLRHMHQRRKYGVVFEMA